MRRGRALFSSLIAVVGALVVVACVIVGVTVSGTSRLSETSGSRTAAATQQQRAAVARASQKRLASSLTVSPAAGATGVTPDTAVVVKTATGYLGSVRLLAANGQEVAGALTAANAWRSTGTLAYSSGYTVATTVVGDLNVQAKSTTSFTTVSPTEAVTGTVFPHSGLVLGVGQPIAIRFSEEVTSAAARADLLRHVSITESKPVPGGWHWFSNREIHFRPQKFWPTGERVNVQWNLNGWNVGGGAWGTSIGQSLFAVGAARISYADLATHQMRVTENGRTIATYPISGGKPKDPTMNGVHLVMDRRSVVHMTSASNGVPLNSPDGYDELVYNDVHISDTGEYVHAAPWSVNSQGHQNVSHGCINLSPANALAFFNFSRVGDIVIVTGSPRPPVVGDHGVMDWDTAWPQFTPAPMPTPKSDVGVRLFN